MDYVCPPDGPLDESWWAPLKAVALTIGCDPRWEFFDIYDFAVMARLVRDPRPSLVLYRHKLTSHYLNLDDDGNAYRFVASRSGGRFVRHKTVSAALTHLELGQLHSIKPRRRHLRLV